MRKKKRQGQGQEPGRADIAGGLDPRGSAVDGIWYAWCRRGPPSTPLATPNDLAVEDGPMQPSHEHGLP